MVFAHAGHWLVNVLYITPVVAFVLWLVVVHVRERREQDSKGPRPIQ